MQIFCDLLLKSAFEQIFNVMQLILVKIKWKYLIQKFHDIALSYYFKYMKHKIYTICAWHKIWTLSGRLSLMRNVQLMKNIYIYSVYTT
jgi:hypothetical protein